MATLHLTSKRAQSKSAKTKKVFDYPNRALNSTASAHSFLQYIEDKAPARIQLKQQQNFTVNMCDATKRLAHISPGTLSATASLSYNVSLFAMS